MSMCFIKTKFCNGVFQCSKIVTEMFMTAHLIRYMCLANHFSYRSWFTVEGENMLVILSLSQTVKGK